jgi:membrane-associated phospholipid phosphatase
LALSADLKNVTLTMRNLRLNPWFFLPYLLVLLVAGIYLSLHEKGDFLLWINSHHAPLLDNIFVFTNEIGEEIFALVMIGALFIFTRYGDALAGSLAWVIAGLTTQLLKREVFADFPRPYKFFEGVRDIYIVPGISVAKHFSFPSGHTTAAFAICTVLALSVKNERWGLFFIIVACIGGLSRIYLAQHFLMDTFLGSIIGTTMGLIIYNAFHLYMDKRPHHLLNRNLLKSLKA